MSDILDTIEPNAVCFGSSSAERLVTTDDGNQLSLVPDSRDQVNPLT